ncbi:MAG: CHAT domain-containing protein, partial [Candidatus Eremiobacterota bacterium]
MAIRTYIVITGFIIMFSAGLCYLWHEYSGNNSKSSLSPSPVLSASQINNMEDLINLLKKTNSDEARKKILAQNKDLVNKDLVIALLVKADSVFDKKYFLTTGKSQQLAQIAVEAAEITGDRATLGKALLYYSIFELLEKREDYNPHSLRKALLLFKEAGDRRGEASCYYRKAKNLKEASDNSYTDKIFELLDKALIISEETGDSCLEGDCFYMKGEIYGYFQWDKDKAIEQFNKAIAIYKKRDDIMSILRSYQVMFDICENNGFLEEAKKYLEIQKQFIEEIKPGETVVFTGKDEGYIFRDAKLKSKDELMMEYYYSFSILYWLTGRYEECIKYDKKVIELGQKLPETAFTEIYAYLGLARTYSLLGQKESALKYYLEAEKKITPQMNINLASGIYVRLGECYIYNMKEPDRAIKYYEMALDRSKNIEMPAFREIYRGFFLRLIGNAYNEKGEFQKAIKKMEEAQEVYEKIYTDPEKIYKDHGVSYLLIKNYESLSYIYQKNGNKEKALECLDRAIKLAEYQKGNDTLASVYWTSGDIYFESQDLSMALKYYIKSLNFWEKTRYSRILWEGYFKIGKVYEKQGNINEAFNNYYRSIEIIENMRHSFKVEELKRDFMQDKIDVYEHMIDILIKMKRGKDAFNYNEKSRARAFLDILANQKIDIHHGVSQELIAKEEELKTRIQYLTGNQNSENSFSDRRSIPLPPSDEKLKELKAEYEKVLEQIKLENPEYMTLISVNPLTLEQIQSLLDKETVIVEYFLGEKNSYVWITGHDSFNTIVIKHNSKDIENLVRAYRTMACDSMTSEKIKSNEWKKISEKLYYILFKEAEIFIAGRKRIIISPHRSLNYFPFQVLIDQKGKMLVEKYEITYLPSASVLKYCKDKNHLKKDSLLAFELGNFKFGDFSPLPGTEKEILEISRHIAHREIYKGKDMTTDILYKEGGHYDILHFATHGTLDAASPLFSSLLFADRTLPVYEIFDLNLKAYLVTLSACRTGLSEDANGDELTGLSRAFIYAGTPTICASLWDVSDVSTSEFMGKFYFYLKDHNKSEALRLAQIDIM